VFINTATEFQATAQSSEPVRVIFAFQVCGIAKHVWRDQHRQCLGLGLGAVNRYCGTPYRPLILKIVELILVRAPIDCNLGQPYAFA
jgi:hypothetical protein